MKTFLTQLMCIVLFTLTCTNLLAQDSTSAKIREYGIGTQGLSSYSLQYRWGNEKRLYRITGTLGNNGSIQNSKYNSDNYSFASASTDKQVTVSPVNLNCNLLFSKIYLKNIGKNIGACYGPGIGFVTSYSVKSSQETRTTYYGSGKFTYVDEKSRVRSYSVQPYIGLTLGFFYKINNSFLLYGDVTPNFFYNYSNIYDEARNYLSDGSFDGKTQHWNSNHSVGIANLSNSNMMLTLAYRITK